MNESRIMKRYKRILITGAAGSLGTQLRKGLVSTSEIIRITDREEMKDIQPREEVVVSNMADLDAMIEATRDVDAVVHFGGLAREADWDSILESNIIGSYNVYEAARRNGVSRIIYASSVHAIGYHVLESHIDADSPIRPDSLYGVAKTFVESLGRLYWDKFGMESLCLRIFSSFPEPADRRMLWSWLSFRDCVQYVERGLLAPRLGHTIAFGMSDNTVSPVDDSKAGHVGFRPQDSAELYRDRVEARTETPDPNAPGVKYLGGWFCDLGHPDDPD